MTPNPQMLRVKLDRANRYREENFTELRTGGLGAAGGMPGVIHGGGRIRL